MHSISSRWRKPKGRSSKRRNAAAANCMKRACMLSKTEDNLQLCSPTTSGVLYQTENDIDKAPNYTVMEENAWSALLSKVPCGECKSINCLRVSTAQSYGFSKCLELICSECGHSFGKTFSSAREEKSRKFKVNQNIVHAFLSIGKGHAALETFSMILGMPSMDRKTFSKCLDNLADKNIVIEKEVLQVSRDLVRKTYFEQNSLQEDSDAIIDITVSYDGTWQKRGHTSLYGIGAVIDIATGVVLDYEVLSKYCPECTSAARDLHEKSAEFEIWQRGHKSCCQNNFDGSSCSMEMCAALILWKRSIEKNKMRYTTVLSDGDAKTHQHLNEHNVYGPGISINKEECINHVAKRLGTALRNKIKEWRIKGVTISGRKRGNLTDATITKLQNYYRKAIKDNAPDIQKMKTSIFATLYHCMSTDKKPNHSKCPTGELSWCFYQRAVACNESPQSHKSMKTQLAEDVVAKVLPVYQRLASDDLLQRCISAKTQNFNECLHSCIWKKCPKEVFVSKKRMELAVTSAVSEFNLGCVQALEIARKNTETNADSVSIAKRRDVRRTAQKERRSLQTYKKPALRKKIQKIAQNNKKERREGATYGAGLF